MYIIFFFRNRNRSFSSSSSELQNNRTNFNSNSYSNSIFIKQKLNFKLISCICKYIHTHINPILLVVVYLLLIKYNFNYFTIPLNGHLNDKKTLDFHFSSICVLFAFFSREVFSKIFINIQKNPNNNCILSLSLQIVVCVFFSNTSKSLVL